MRYPYERRMDLRIHFYHYQILSLIYLSLALHLNFQENLRQAFSSSQSHLDF